MHVCGFVVVVVVVTAVLFVVVVVVEVVVFVVTVLLVLATAVVGFRGAMMASESPALVDIIAITTHAVVPETPSSKPAP